MHERASFKSFRDARVVTRALEARLNPIEDGTLPRTTATLQSLQHWPDVHAGLLQQSVGKITALSDATARRQMGNDSTLGFYRHSTIENTANKSKLDDCILMVVIASIYRHAARCEGVVST